MGYRIKSNQPSGGMIDETELLSRKDHLLLFVEQNRKAVLGGLVFVVLAAVVGGVVMWLERQQSQEAWILEGQAQALYLDRPLDDQEKSQDSVKKATELYQQIVKDFPRTTPAQSALYLLGNSFMEQKDFPGAIQTYQQFLDQYARNAMLQGLVRQRLAYAYLLNGDRDQAVQEFSNVLSAPEVYNKDQVLFELAKLEESDGAMEKALGRYKDLLTQFPTSPYASEASLRVQALSPEENSSDPVEPEKEASTEPTLPHSQEEDVDKKPDEK